MSVPVECLASASNHMHSHAKELRALVARTLRVPENEQSVKDLRDVLLQIDELAEYLDNISFLCDETVEKHTPRPLDAHITEEDLRVARELHDEDDPPTPKGLADFCDERGVDYEEFVESYSPRG